MRLRGVRGHCSCAIRRVAIGGMRASAETANAQNAVEARAARDTVNARSRPGYEPPPIRFGPLEVAPVLQVDATVTDNLYARSDVKVRDVGIALRPGIVLASRGPNPELAVRADARLERYASHRSEDTQSFDASANGRLNDQSAAGLYSAQKLADDRAVILRNRVAAFSLVGVGAAGVIVGAILTAHSGHEPARQPSAFVTPAGGAGVCWSGRF